MTAGESGFAESGFGAYTFPPMSAKKSKSNNKEEKSKDDFSVARNKKARHDYEILDSLEAGLVLTGAEVKALRTGPAILAGAFVRERNGELWLEGLEIPRYRHASTHLPHFPNRSRKLLVKRKEINRLTKSVDTKGLSIIALHLYFTRGMVKVEIGLGRGKKLHDKRADMKKRDVERNLARLSKQRDRR